MRLRQRTGSTPCIYCGLLVAVTDAQCWNCKRFQPSLWGFSPLLRRFGRDLGFVPLVTAACGLLYLLTVALSMGPLEGARRPGGLFGALSPSSEALFLFGATGAIPVVGYGRWWTVLAAAWLHGGLLHIVFNLLWIRMLAPAVAEAYGAGRMVILYTVAAIAGGVATTFAATFMPFLPAFLRGAGLAIGASGAVFGLLGAIVYYGRRTGRAMATQQAWVLAGLLFLFGLIMPGVDNWGHAGGFAGGYLAATLLDPTKPERGTHLLIAAACLVASAASIVASIAHGFVLTAP